MMYAVKVRTKGMVVNGKMEDVSHMNWTDTVYVPAVHEEEARRKAVDYCRTLSGEYVEVVSVAEKGGLK